MEHSEQIAGTINSKSDIIVDSLLDNINQKLYVKFKESAYLSILKYIVPYWYPEKRYFYTKGNDDLVIAKLDVMMNNWESAYQLWDNYKNDTNTKIAQRACFNLALANEMKGNLQEAYNMANYTYGNYNLFIAKIYSKKLKKRLEDQAVIEIQLENY